MSIVRDIKLYFHGWNFGLLAVVIVVLALITAFSFNVPVGEPEEFKGEVIEVGLHHSSKYSASYANVRVRLSNGAEADVTLPRGVMVSPGDAIIIERQALLIKGAFYKYGHLPDAL
jgi:hypothetical protein